MTILLFIFSISSLFIAIIIEIPKYKETLTQKILNKVTVFEDKEGLEIHLNYMKSKLFLGGLMGLLTSIYILIY